MVVAGNEPQHVGAQLPLAAGQQHLPEVQSAERTEQVAVGRHLPGQIVDERARELCIALPAVHFHLHGQGQQPRLRTLEIAPDGGQHLQRLVDLACFTQSARQPEVSGRGAQGGMGVQRDGTLESLRRGVQVAAAQGQFAQAQLAVGRA